MIHRTVSVEADGSSSKVVTLAGYEFVLSIGCGSPFASLALSSPNGYLFDIVQLHSYRFHVEHFRSISSFSALPLFWWALPRFRSPQKKDLAEGST